MYCSSLGLALVRNDIDANPELALLALLIRTFIGAKICERQDNSQPNIVAGEG